MHVHLTEKGREKTRKKTIQYVEDEDIVYRESYIIVQSKQGKIYTLVPDDIQSID